MTHPNDPGNYDDGVEHCDRCGLVLEFGVAGLPIYRITPAKGQQETICDNCADRVINVTNYKLIECISGYGGKA